MRPFSGKVIQVGVGGFGASWVRRFRERRDRYEVVDIVDVSEAALSTAAEELQIGPARRWTDLGEALSTTTAELAVIVTPPAVHCEQVLACLAAGKHVILAKPMAPTWEECVCMVEASERAERVFAIEQNYRYYPENLQFREALQAEGKTTGHVDVEFFINADFGAADFRTGMVHPLTLDMVIHHVDLLRFFTGLNAEWVVAVEHNPPWSWYRHPSGLRMLIGLENGLVACYRGCWASGGAATNWSGNWRIQTGERRTLVKTAHRIEVWTSEGWGRNSSLTPVPYSPDKYAGFDCLEEVVCAIREGRASATSGADNLESIGIVLAAAASAEAGGQRVPVPKRRA